MKTALFLFLTLLGVGAHAAQPSHADETMQTIAAADTPLDQAVTDHECQCLTDRDCEAPTSAAEETTMDRAAAEKMVIPGLDPGINRTVHFLIGAGFKTTDSGDGKTKLAEGWSPDEARDVPHVTMVCDPSDLTATCDLLRSVLETQGVRVVASKPPDEPCSPGEAVIEGVYLVGAGVAIIDLVHLDDAGLTHARSKLGS